MSALLGCIADDFTGGTDLAGMLVGAGMRTVQTIGVPGGPPPADAQAIVVALKSRTAPVAQAVEDSLAALRWLRSAGCRQFYFKICSTFDSTPAGNIGPVAEALLDALDANFTVVCPAFPANGRTIYKGHLFVGDRLLSESGMERHPLTPMTDANLMRVLQPQVEHPVGLVDHRVVSQGARAIAARCDELRAGGTRFAIVDAITDQDLIELGRACKNNPLVVAGSGLAIGLPGNFADNGAQRLDPGAASFSTPPGLRAVVSGSCSSATQRQVAAMKALHPSFRVDALQLQRGEDVVAQALAWAGDRIAHEPVLVYATASPDEVAQAQHELGVERAGALVEGALAEIAAGLAERGVTQLIVAGGETSGAVVKRLGVETLRIGSQIDPGVPWTLAQASTAPAAPMALALKSGNFGTDDFFQKAWAALPLTIEGQH